MSYPRKASRTPTSTRKRAASPVVLLATLILSATGFAGVSLKEIEKDGWKTIEMENSLVKVVLIPGMARFPYSYVFKPTGHDYMLHPLPLSTPVPDKGDRFVYYGGLIDSVPWVSGKATNRHFEVKGFLHFSKWEYETGTTSNSAWFSGTCGFSYQQPYSGEHASLRVTKKMTVFEGSPMLRMEYRVENTSRNEARFTFCIHTRTCIDEYDEGDYFWAPGKQTFVYELYKMDKVRERGIELFKWADWPLPEACTLTMSDKTSYIFTYTPANWCVAGDPESREALFFVAGPIRYRTRRDIMKMGIFMTNKAYVVQPCLSYALQVQHDIWDQPGATVSLPPGECCEFVLDMTGYHGIEKRQSTGAFNALPEVVLLDEPQIRREDNVIRLKGKLFAASAGRLVVMTGADTLCSHEIKPGLIDLGELDLMTSPRGGPVGIHIVTSAGTVELYAEKYLRGKREE